MRVTIPDNDRTTTTIPGAHSDGYELSYITYISEDIRLMCGGYTGEHEEISLFTLVDIAIIKVNGELSEPLEIRLGELPKYISMAERSGRAVLMTAEGHDQTDILEFLEKSE